MILSNLWLELEHIVGTSTVDNLINEVIHEVMEDFYQSDSGLILESVHLDGSFRIHSKNPGHVIEAMWFMMDLADRRKDLVLMDK